MAAAPELTDRWAHVPAELRERPQWVVWRWADRNGKLTKPPYRADAPATEASSTDPGTWCSFEAAIETSAAAPGVAGIGYVFAPDDPYCGVDFDNVISPNGNVVGWAADWLETLGGYQEVSPSGTGIKVFVRASVDRGHGVKGKGIDGRSAVEVYNRGRYFTVTGQPFACCDAIPDRQEVVDRLIVVEFPARSTIKPKSGQPPTLPLFPGDDELIEAARKAENGEKFTALFDRGDASAYPGKDGEPDRSAADLALCSLLAFFTGPAPAAIDRLFRRSRLMRPKWDEKRGQYTYGERTIDKALDGKTEFYSGPSERPGGIRGAGYTVPPLVEDSADSADDADASESEEVEWIPPRLGEEDPPEPFPVDVFPPRLQDFIREAARSLECPPDYVAAPMLAAAGGAIGMTVNLEVKAHYAEAPNLFLAVVGPPGTKKSPALKVVCRPIEEIDRRNKDLYDADRARYEQQKADHHKGQIPPTPPVMTELVLDDATREAVAVVHGRNRRGVVMVKGELVAWVSSLNQFKQGGKGDDKQFWLKVYSGEMVKVNRKGGQSGAPPEPIIIPRPCVAVVGCLTPDMLPAIRDDKRDDGWLDRILFAYPEPIFSEEWTEDEISDEAVADWDAVIRRLWDRKQYVDAEQGRLRPFYVGMTDAAKVRWRQFIKEHRAELRSHESAPFRGPWSKLEGACARLALILSLVEHACEPGDRPPTNVGADHVHNAARLIVYFKDHFKRSRLAIIRRETDGGYEGQLILGWLERSARRGREDPSGSGFPALFASRQFSWFSGRDVSRQFTRWDDYQQSVGIRWLVGRRCIRPRLVPPRESGRRGAPHGPEYDVNPHLLTTWRLKETSAKSAMSAEMGAVADWLRSRLSPVSPGDIPPVFRSRDVLDEAERAGFDPVDVLEAVKIVGARRFNTPDGVAWGFTKEDIRDSQPQG